MGRGRCKLRCDFAEVRKLRCDFAEVRKLRCDFAEVRKLRYDFAEVHENWNCNGQFELERDKDSI